MFERWIQNPISSLAGLLGSVLGWISVSPNGFTWKGLLAVLPALLIGGFSKDK